ncbi:choice-of-anchor Q domain-containing protein [Pontiellaceae bacterium B12219]|nr:choice-of-anchor Q domain-containing protein [Pontiellaceae bacterium B12219]
MKNDNRFFTVFWLILIAALTASAQNIPTNGLTAHWSFDGNLDNSTLASGNTSPANPSNLNLTAGGGTGFELNGLFGQAAHFDGIDDYLQLTGAPAGEVVEDDPLPATTTISVWFKADSAPSGTARYMVYETAPNFTLSLGLREGSNTANTKVQVYSDLLTGTDPFTSVEIPDSEIAGQWVHALMTLSHDAGGSESLTIRVNNHIDATATFEADVSDFQVFGDFHIGTYRISNARWFPGLIDELAVWERELTTQEIDQLATGPTLVTTLTDEDDSPGAGSETSLREAVKYSAGGSIITFDPALSGQTILLTNGQIQINKSLSIDASAIGGISIDGNANGRIFEIASGATSALSGLTITNGLASGSVPGDKGGGIYIRSGAYLALDNAIITGNDGRSYGGGIFNDGTTTVSNCTLTGNSAQLGAAIYNYGSGIITANNSTLANNVAGNEGGGIQNFGNATFNNSTIAGNSAPNNGGGIYSVSSASSVTLNNSIVAGNTALAGADIYDNADNGPTHTVGENIVGNASGYTINSGTAPIIANPLLAPLGDYGGFTPTMPPMAGSPAIDAGGTADFFTDQRGLTRIVNGTVDIGAVERQLPIVLNLADSGYGSLRDVINFSDSGTTVIFTNALSGGTIILTSGQILIDKNLAVDASTLPGGITIDGNGSVTGQRVFEFTAGTTNLLKGLTISGGRTADGNNGATGNNGSNGDHGGGIWNASHLTLLNCTVSGNATGNGGNGGDGANGGLSGFGGGIHNLGNLFLQNCTIAGNATGSGGAGGYPGGTGGNSGGAAGIYSSGTVTLQNSTISDNHTGNAGFGNGGNGIRGNGGGILISSSTLNSFSSIIAGNTANTEPNLSGAVSSGSNNLIDADPQLAPLGNYGGPTSTMPPLPGSPAIDAGGSTTLATDQRGAPRDNGISDIGAVEFQSVVRNVADSGQGSLREITLQASPGTTITFTNTLDGQTILLASGQLFIDRSISIDASALPGGLTIDANGLVTSNRVFEFTAGTTNILNGLTITGGRTADGSNGSDAENGGGILNDGHLTLLNCSVTNNATGRGGHGDFGGHSGHGDGGHGGHGGGVYNDSGSLTLGSSTVSGNSTGNGGDGDFDSGGYSGYGGFGGGVYNRDGSLTLENSTVSENSTGSGGDGGYGGGVYNDTGSFTLENSTVSGNSAGSGGYGIFAVGYRGGDGGGVYNRDGSLTLDNSTVSGNSTGSGGYAFGFGGDGGDGGGVYNGSGFLTLKNSTVSGNSTGRGDYGDFADGDDGGGGGIYNESGSLTLGNATISGNTARGIGGGVGGGTFNSTNSIIAGNMADQNPNLNGAITNGFNNLTNGVPQLAPLGDYGGPTQTMPPLPGSPAIDAGGITTFTNDQRGFARVVGTVDIGAVEIQDSSDSSLILTSLWSTDADGDGQAFGVEFALGTDWNIADGTNSANLVAHPDGGVVFGINLDAEEHTVWIIKRSQNLVTDPFVEVYRYDGPTSSSSGTIPAFVNKTADHIELNDQSGVTNAFYQFEAELNL